jgi:hypothetical protein
MAGTRTKNFGDIADKPSSSQLSVTLVSFLMLVRDWIRWSRPRVQIAKSAITGNDIRIARPESAVLAVPVHFSFAVYYRALDRKKFRTMLRPQWQ